MKISAKNIFFALGATAILASCGENSWNDHLDGFEPGIKYDTPIEAEFTMSGTDYNAVASNSTNKSLAEAAGLANALKAVGNNALFSAEIPAKEYLPAFLASSSAPYFLAPSGSKVNVTYQETGVTDPIIAQVADAQKYTVSKDDYVSAWGSDKDYIDAFAPMTPAENKIPAILKNAYPDAASGDLAIVSYNESSTNPIFISDSEVEEFIGGTFYLIADGSNGAGPLSSKNYGYLPRVEISVTDGTVSVPGSNIAPETYAFTFIPTTGGYYIKDVENRFIYQQGTYNSFNFSTSLPESGAVWTVDIASNGQATITNTEVGKWIQYDGNYSSWGSYAEAKGSLPMLYKAPDPKYYLVTEDGQCAGPVAADKTYGYLSNENVLFDGELYFSNHDNAFTFEITKGGYYIKDSYGRYLYMKGTYNNFNLSAELPEAGGIWTLTEDESGFVTITNAEMGKWLQYDGGYNSWGAYAEEKGSLPKMYNAVAYYEYPTSLPSKVVAGTPVTANMTAVYKFDGSKWAPAEGVTALDAADYTAMGFAANKLDNADIYLPLFLKNTCPYAVEGDTMAVVYNGASCAVLVYDGQNWTINNDDLQTKTAQFVKEGNNWKFVKYVGKAYFNYTTELTLDRAYLIVADGICAIPTATSKNYGYMYTEAVNIVNGVIEQKNEANGFTFASSAIVGDKEYKLGEGQFFIVDSNGRYSYMSGTYTSFNLAEAPVVTDGTVDPAYIWTATCEGGLWTIKNVGNGKWIQYAANYSSWGSYDTENGSLPELYILAAE
ncbi:MAG: hypothetical protein K2N35_08195 [Muribaculaceae bacterium]|nr:hypothetical protein [Muribaculaceae bacterium]